MNKKMLRIFLVLCFLTASASANSEIQNKNAGNNMIDYDKTKNWCVGRYSIQLPAEAKFYEQIDSYNAFDIKTITTNATQDDLNHEIQSVLKEFSTYGSLILKEGEIEKFGSSITKTIWVKLNPTAVQVQVYSFVLDKRTLFAISGAYGSEFSNISKEAITNLVRKLKQRNNQSVPNEKGFCINNGFIYDDGSQYRFSEQRLILDFPNYPSVDLTFESTSVFENDGGLIKRMSNNLKEEGMLSKILNKVKTIRKGPKTVNGLSGEEWVVEAPMKGKNGIDAVWAYSGIADNNLFPSIQLSFTSANTLETDSASLGQKEAEMFYEEILKTIKKF